MLYVYVCMYFLLYNMKDILSEDGKITLTCHNNLGSSYLAPLISLSILLFSLPSEVRVRHRKQALVKKLKEKTNVDKSLILQGYEQNRGRLLLN